MEHVAEMQLKEMDRSNEQMVHNGSAMTEAFGLWSALLHGAIVEPEAANESEAPALLAAA